MEIRRIRPGDLEALRTLRLRALATDPDAFGERLEQATIRPDADWRAWTEAPERGVFVAFDDRARFVGMAVGSPVVEREQTVGLYGMWVAPETRGQGIGAGLIEAVEGWARLAGYETIGLGVTTTNHPAIRLYERMGYADTGERHPLREGSDLTIQVMGKRL